MTFLVSVTIVTLAYDVGDVGDFGVLFSAIVARPFNRGSKAPDVPFRAPRTGSNPKQSDFL